MASAAQQLLKQNNDLSKQYIQQASAANQAMMDFNSLEAQKERDWSEYMSNTSHLREVQDLRNAGLNPILSAYSGGASGYTGSSASADNAYASVLGNLANAALQTASSLAQTFENNSTAVKTATIGANATKAAAKTSAKATKAAAKTSAQASMHNADVSASAMKYSADKGYDSAVASASISANAQVQVANIAAKNNIDVQKLKNFVEKRKQTLNWMSQQKDRENAEYIAKMKTLTESFTKVFNTGSTNAANIIRSLIGVVDFF